MLKNKCWPFFVSFFCVATSKISLVQTSIKVDNVDTFQSLEISLERRAFNCIAHPSSDRRRVRDAPESSPLKQNFKTLKGIYIIIKDDRVQ